MKRIAFAFLFVSQLAFAVDPFSLPWMNHETPGTSFNTKDYPDGVFVAHFYWLGCMYNHKLEPLINDIASDYASEPRVHVLDIGADKKDVDYTHWVDAVQPNHAVLKDATRVIFKAFEVVHVPTTVIFDGGGNVHHKYVGPWNATQEKKVREVIDWLLLKP